MLDMAMCQNKECPKAKICLRFTAQPSARQTYVMLTFTEDGCRLFWDNRKGDEDE